MFPMMSPGGPQGGPPPSIQIPGGGGSTPGGPDTPEAADALEAAAQAIQQFISDEKDPEDRAIAAKILAQIHSISAGRQKEQDAAMGTSPAMKMVRRANSG